MGAIYEKTDNLGLNLYGDKDPADLRDGHNDNMRKLDEAIKSNIDAISQKPNASNVYTKAESDDLLLKKASLADVYTRSQIDTTYPIYPSFATLRTSDKPTAGQIVHVMGFSTPSDGGEAYWQINTTAAQNRWNISIAHDLTATLIDSPVLRPEQFGEPGDWSDIFNFICAVGSPYSGTLELTGGKTYDFTSTVQITKTMHVHGNGAVLSSKTALDAFTVNIATDERLFGEWEGITFKATGAQTVLHIVSGFKGRLAHDSFIGFAKTGLKHDSGYEMIFDDLRFEASTTSAESVGFTLLAGDCSVSNIVLRDCHTGIKLASSTVSLSNIHGWILTRSLITGSIMIDCTNDGLMFGEYIYNDTYQYGLYLRQNERVNITHFFQYFNADIWGDPNVDGSPSTSESIHYDNESASRYTDIRQASLRANVTHLDALFTACKNWLGNITVTDWYGINFASIKFSQAVNLNLADHVSAADGGVIVRDNIAYINIDLKLDGVTTLDNLFTLAPYMAQERVICTAMFTGDAWNVDVQPRFTTAIIDKYASGFTMHKFFDGSYTGFAHLNVTVPIYQQLG